MAKTYTCNLCPGKTFDGHAGLKRHEKWDPDHRANLRTFNDTAEAERKVREELEGALRVWGYAHSPRIGGWDTLEAARKNGMDDSLAYALYTQNEKLADDLRELAKEAERVRGTMQRDVLDRIAEGGATRIYGTNTSTSAIHDVQVAEGKVMARLDALRSLASALGVHCEATYTPSEWAFLEAVAQFAVISNGTGGRFFLVNELYAVNDEFPSHDAAVLECVRRVRQVAEQTRKAMSEAK